MTKSELKEWIENNESIFLPKLVFSELLSKIDQLSEPEPDTIPFTWPIPDGYKVIRLLQKGFEGGDISQFHYFGENLNDYIAAGIYKGELCRFERDELVLLPVEPEMVTVWLNYYGDKGFTHHATEELADMAAAYNRIGPAIRVQFEKPKNS